MELIGVPCRNFGASQPSSLRRAHTDPFPLAVRVIQALVMLLGILVDQFQMNQSTEFFFFFLVGGGGSKKSILLTLQGTNISHLWKRKIIDIISAGLLVGDMIWDSSQEGILFPSRDFI